MRTSPPTRMALATIAGAAAVLTALWLGGWLRPADPPRPAPPPPTAPVAAAPPPGFLDPTKLPAARPIPQDADRIARRRRDHLTWCRRTLAGAYDQVGRKDPRWDGPALRALELAARSFAAEVDPEVTPADIRRAAGDALDAGCDDPMVAYLHARALSAPGGADPVEAARRLREAAAALASSRYPAFRRAIALELAGRSALAPEAQGGTTRDDGVRSLDAALALVRDSAAADERNDFWEDQWIATLHGLIAGYRAAGYEPPAALERVDSALADVPEMRLVRLLVRGQFWIYYGWEARTTAVAALVPQGGFEALDERLALARTALEDAWRLRPEDGRAPRLLLTVEKGGGGDPGALGVWFERAMKANGDDEAACAEMLDCLDPKWHGTDEAMLAFGRACRATGNWRAGITLLAADAHLRYASRLGAPAMSEYLRSPVVWPEIEAVFEEYLKHRPSDAVARSKYAALAYLATRGRVAQAQFEALGDRLTSWRRFPSYPLESLKKMREATAWAIANDPRAGGP